MKKYIAFFFLNLLLISFTGKCFQSKTEGKPLTPNTIASNSEVKISLNGLWNFKADYYNEGERQAWFAVGFNDSGWDKLPVPGNWDLRNEYANYSGKGWYRTSFETPADIDGKVVRLNFEAVGIDYKVWLNGSQIANVTGGYFPNYIDISRKLEKGIKNSLVVCADNTFRSGAYWSWGGIRRPVALVINEPLFIRETHVTAIPDLKKGTASVSFNVSVCNKNEVKENVSLEYELVFDGKPVKKGTLAISLSGLVSQTAIQEFTLNKKDVRLWHIDHPNLYTLIIRLKQGNNLYHEVSERIGIRKVEIAGHQFLLNGESIRGMGLNWVADDRFTGNTLPVELYKRDIDNMKSLGVCIARLSHLPLPKEVYDYLDEKGMMIIAEIPVWGVTKLAEPDNQVSKSWMKQLVTNNFNHPAIIGWCVGNEIGRKDPGARVTEYVDKAVRYVKDSLDHSRLVVMVSHTANWWKDDPSQFGDFVPYNTYGDWSRNVEKVHENQPDKMVFISECGGNLIGEDLNTSTGDFIKMLNDFRGREYLFGASIWTYNDYRSNFRSDNITWDSKISQNRDWGLIDGYGNKKRAFYIIRKEFAPLKSLRVKGNGNNIDVTLAPRSKLDLPAYTLHDYKLVCEDMGKDNMPINKTEIILPEVKPGDAQFSKSFVVDGNPAARRISLVNPVNYNLMDTTIYYQSPAKPVIKAVFSTGDKIRVVFDHLPLANEYKLRYGDRDLNLETSPTIDHFIEVQKLTGNKEYGRKVKIQLVTINGFGESRSEIHTVELSGFNVFPPVIKAVSAFQNGINMGYSSEKNGYLFKVQYSTTADFSADSHIIQTTSKGACYIPDLKPGMTYYVRMCVVEQYEVQSPWSEVWSVKI